MEFTYKLEKKKDYSVLHFKGNLIEKSQAIELLDAFDELLNRNMNRIVVDMTDFGYMNSTGLNVLIQILTKARKSGGEAVISSVPDNIKSLMLITKLNSIFTVVDDEAAAEKILLKEA
jgi:anti-sigma B factor antagonist